MEINKVFISLGSNLGNRIGNLLSAKFEIINQIGEIIKESRIYESEPWGLKSQPTFLNQVIIIKSLFNANDILKKCLLIEKTLGRIRKQKWDSRIIDIDILYFNNEIINQKDLSIPHPEIQNRNFVLVPLIEIENNYLHPEINKTNQDLLKLSKDNSKVSEYGMGLK